MWFSRDAIVLCVIVIAVLSFAPVSSGDIVHDSYDARFVSPSSVECLWNGTIDNMTIDSHAMTWQEIVDAGLEDDAKAIAFAVANQTMSGVWMQSSVEHGTPVRSGNVASCVLTLTLTPGSYFLDQYVIVSLDDLINATLEMGGSVDLWTTVTAQEGHEANLTFDTDGLGGSPLLASPGSGPYTFPTNITADGLGGISQSNRYVTIHGLTGFHDEDPVIDAVVDMSTIRRYVFDATVNYTTFVPAEHGVKIPTPLDIPVLNAGGMRVFVGNGIATWSEVASATENNLTDGGVDIEGALDHTFESNATVNFSWAEGTEDAFSYVPGRLHQAPPIVAVMDTASPVGLFDVEPDTLFGFFNSGGRAKIEVDMDLVGYVYSFLFGPPSGLAADPVGAASSGRNALWNGTGRLNVSLWLRSVTAPAVIRNDTSVNIDIDLSDIALLSRRMDYTLDAKGRISWMEVTESLEGGIPRNMEIDMVCADLIRLMYDKGLVDDEDIHSITDQIKDGIENESAFRSEVKVEFSGHHGEYDIHEMDGKPAVTFTIVSEGSMGLTGGGSMIANMVTVPLEFELVSIEGWKTRYSILLPEGLTIAKKEVSEGNISKVSDGFKHRLIVDIPEDVEKVEVKLTLNVGLMFLISQFCLLFQAMLVIVVLLSLFKAWRFYRERKAEKKDDGMIVKGLKARAAISTLRAARDAEAGDETPPRTDEGPPPDERPPRERGRPPEGPPGGRRPGEERYGPEHERPPRERHAGERRPPARERPPEGERRPREMPPEEQAPAPPEVPETRPEEPPASPGRSPEEVGPTEPEEEPPVLGRPGPQTPEPDMLERTRTDRPDGAPDPGTLPEDGGPDGSGTDRPRDDGRKRSPGPGDTSEDVDGLS